MRTNGPVLSYSELTSFAAFAQVQFDGAQLQEIWTNGEQIVFQFYKFKELYLLFQLQAQQPRAAIFKSRPKVDKKAKPVTLFLNSHAKNLHWEKMWTQGESGRVLFLSLASNVKSCEIEIHLIPRNVNLIVHADGKKVAWEKPRELPASTNPEAAEDLGDLDWWTESSQWWDQKLSGGKKSDGVSKAPQSAKQDPRKRALEKKAKAREALQAQLVSGESDRYQSLGESLKLSSDVPADLKDLYDEKLSPSQNMQKAFAKVKDLQRKRQGVMDRLATLEKEIANLEETLINTPVYLPEAQAVSSSATKILEKSGSKGRKKIFENGIEAVLGKSAQDNLSILRQAQAWHLWVHLKDDPGAHAIILRGRNQKVPPKVIEEVAEWVMKESSGNKGYGVGVRYEVIVVECRHVRPIKGDRLGRVTYHYPQVFSFASKS